MTQNELKEQAFNYINDNLNNETILKLITELLEIIANELYQDGFVNESNKITTCYLKIIEILKDNGGCDYEI